jgi:hypothetical protein
MHGFGSALFPERTGAGDLGMRQAGLSKQYESDQVEFRPHPNREL